MGRFRGLPKVTEPVRWPCQDSGSRSLPFPFRLHPLEEGTAHGQRLCLPLGWRDFTAAGLKLRGSAGSVPKFVSLPTHLNPYFKEKEKSPSQITIGAQSE